MEEICERISKDEAISALSKDATSATYIPLRVREIVKETLTTLKQDSTQSQENASLKKELLSVRKENIDLGIKHMAVSEKVSDACFITLLRH